MTTEIVLLKLGGSLITDKDKPFTPRLDKLADLALEIKTVLDSNPNLLLILGHGSGSFGHVAAKKHGTRDGVRTREQWMGFAEVRFQAAELNRYVMAALVNAGIPAVSFPPSSSMVSKNRKVIHHNILTIRKALDVHLLPVVHGDVAFDEALGGTILSTEDVFKFLVEQFSPARILLAGIEAGVWEDFPARTKKVERITPDSFEEVSAGVGKAAGADVTGGMESKIRQMLGLVQEVPGLTAQVFSGDEPGNLARALTGDTLGTVITA